MQIVHEEGVTKNDKSEDKWNGLDEKKQQLKQYMDSKIVYSGFTHTT